MLTSPHDCDSCIHKYQKIAELEQRISNLYWIRDEEMRLDPVVAASSLTGPLPAARRVGVSVLRPPVRSTTSASRHRIMKEAALKAPRPGGPPGHEESCETPASL